MIFLVQYNRRAGRLVRFECFCEDQRHQAVKKRFELEIELRHRGEFHEVVLLEAVSEEILHETHARYFFNMSGLVTAMGRAVENVSAARESG